MQFDIRKPNGDKLSNGFREELNQSLLSLKNDIDQMLQIFNLYIKSYKEAMDDVMTKAPTYVNNEDLTRYHAMKKIVTTEEVLNI